MTNRRINCRRRIKKKNEQLSFSLINGIRLFNLLASKTQLMKKKKCLCATLFSLFFSSHAGKLCVDHTPRGELVLSA